VECLSLAMIKQTIHIQVGSITFCARRALPTAHCTLHVGSGRTLHASSGRDWRLRG
jgi:hypothetical protein